MSGVLGMILAGGEGTRLMPLTESRSKPAVPFGGSYRILDFVMNNFVNSGIIKIFVITQYKSQSLQMHLKKGWQVSGITGAFIDALPAQMRVSREWYQGTADAVYQNLTFLKEQFPEHVCIFGSDHIYKMDIRKMLTFHKEKNATLTVSAIKMKAEECSGKFGIIEVDENWKMIGFEEKPAEPKSKYGVYAEYIYPRNLLPEVKKYLDEGNSCDAPGNLVVYMYKQLPTYAYEFTGVCYDVGTHEALAEVNQIYTKEK